MANPGIGYRRANDLLIEISFHMLQPVCFTTLTADIAVGQNVGTPVASMAAIYPGAMLVVDTGVNQEVVTIASLGVTGSPPVPAFFADYNLPHLSGTRVSAATFPLQSATDPLFTQSEMLGYLSRAQNQFLLDVPCIFQLSVQTVLYAEQLQFAPTNTVEMERIASSTSIVTLVSLTRIGGLVTAVSNVSHGLATGQKFSILFSAPGYAGSFVVATVPSDTSWTYVQAGSDGYTTEGSLGLWSRLYEVTQQELGMRNPAWRSRHITRLNSWYEDRTGLYQWGVDGIPAANIPVEILASVRDSDSLQLSDGFLVPDPLLHYVKYKALETCFTKDGEMRDPLRAAYCLMRYQRGVAAARRWMDAAGMMGAGGGRA